MIMPEPRKLTDSDRFNLMLALVGNLIDGAEYDVPELAKHFKVPEVEITNAVKNLGFIEINHHSPYGIDFDELEDGNVAVNYKEKMSLKEVPRLSARQASALAAGLVYLKSIPGLADSDEIETLQKIIASGFDKTQAPEIKINPIGIDLDIRILRQAINKGVAIKCDYQDNKGVTSIGRVIEPLRIDPQSELIYLRGWCQQKQALRSFRIDRMRNTVILPDVPISEAAKQAELQDEIYVPSDNDIEVVLEVEPGAYGLMYDLKPIAETVVINKTSRRFTVKVGDVRNLGPLVTRYGGGAKVISPADAKKAVRDFALAAINPSLGSVPKDAE
jgi:proteasome accessory factor C